jgi:ABC-2 type transport system permease protein
VSALLPITLREQRRSFVGWGLGLGGVALMYSAFYPSIQTSSAQFRDYLNNLPDAVRNVIGADFTTPAGYLRSELFSTLGLILLLVWAIGAGGRAIAGEEEAGTLDLLLSTPLRRGTILRDKAIAGALITVGLAFIVFVVVAVFGPPFDISVPTADLAVASALLALLTIGFGAIALAVGAATGHKGLADAVAGGLALFTYVLNALGSTVDALRPLRPVSPFRWYLDPDPLTSGLHWQNVLVLLAIPALAYLVAVLLFDRRDIAAA